jgi:hypothetical protein
MVLNVLELRPKVDILFILFLLRFQLKLKGEVKVMKVEAIKS